MITLQSRDAGKPWGTLNRFGDENHTMERGKLLEHIRKQRDDWHHALPRKEYRIVEDDWRTNTHHIIH